MQKAIWIALWLVNAVLCVRVVLERDTTGTALALAAVACVGPVIAAWLTRQHPDAAYEMLGISGLALGAFALLLR